MNISKIYKDLEFNRYGVISILVIVVGCLGGITVAVGAIKSIFALCLVVFPTMAVLSMVLAIAPMKYIMWVAAISTLINICLILMYTL